jgi:FlaA1/EpsC-like NDP-sugar epimerase
MDDLLRYEEITGNPPPTIDLDPNDFSFFHGKTILVTGAGGSIGSRIVNHLAKVPNIKLLAVDRDENALHSLSLTVSNTALFQEAAYILLDIRDKVGVERIIADSRPATIIHCAALKHLSVLERFPREAVMTNVFGTKNLIDSAIRNDVTTFLNVSTDKAVKPSSILGKTKRIAELVTIQARNNGFHGYTNVRFGNVFNSKGSVIETFTHQIINNAPITLTDSSMRRYFMHIDEAAALAIKSSVINAGPIHILDMGVPVLLVDVIERIKAVLKSNAEIVITGARQGEKFNEDLMNIFENSSITSDPKIRALKSNQDGIEIDEDWIIDDDSAALAFIARYID